MKKLTNTNVSRGGRTARSWSHETSKAELDTEEEDGSAKLKLGFSMSSKGGGITDVKVSIGSEDFAALVSAMVVADRECAMREIVNVLASEIAKQSKRDREIIREARQSVIDAAKVAYSQAPKNDSDSTVKQVVLYHVRQYVAELNELDAVEPTE